MKIKAAVLLLCSIASVGAVAASKTPQPSSIYYELKLKSENYGNMGTRKMWIKGQNMRWEAESDTLPLRLIKNNDGVFLLHPWRKLIAKYPDASPRGNPMSLFPGPVGPVKTFLKNVGASKKGTEKVSGQRCDVYSYTDPCSHRPVKIWVGVASGKPAKLFMKGERKKIDTITATYTRFDVGAIVPDSLFQLPKGYAVRSMPKPGLTSKAKPTVKKSA